MAFAHRNPCLWQLGARTLPLGSRTLVMGVVNVTPDSFFDGSRFLDTQRATEQALRMFEEGAAIIDIGGESTRPGHREPLAITEELDRVLPVIEAVLKQRPGSILSIDTYKAETAKAGVYAGAEIVNDVSGLLWDAQMAATCAALPCGLVLMHTRGRPDEWRTLPKLPPREVVPLVKAGLEGSLQAALQAGIGRQRIVLDPGYGFGKAFDNNYPLLARQQELQSLGQPLLAGVSRKSFLGRALAHLNGGVDVPAAARGTATIAAMTAAILGGAYIVRVHDVRPAVEAAAIADAILGSLFTIEEPEQAGAEGI